MLEVSLSDSDSEDEALDTLSYLGETEWQRVPRKDKSLGVLATQVLEALRRNARGGYLDLPGAATFEFGGAWLAREIGANERRIVDVYSVMRAAGVLQRICTDTYLWMGVGAEPAPGRVDGLYGTTRAFLAYIKACPGRETSVAGALRALGTGGQRRRQARRRRKSIERKTVGRRLYDVINVLCVLGMLRPMASASKHYKRRYVYCAAN